MATCQRASLVLPAEVKRDITHPAPQATPYGGSDSQALG